MKNNQPDICSICWEPKLLPSTLGCGHSCCSSCILEIPLQLYQGKPALHCPVVGCDFIVFIPDGGISLPSLQKLPKIPTPKPALINEKYEDHKIEIASPGNKNAQTIKKKELLQSASTPTLRSFLKTATDTNAHTINNIFHDWSKMFHQTPTPQKFEPSVDIYIQTESPRHKNPKFSEINEEEEEEVTVEEDEEDWSELIDPPVTFHDYFGKLKPYLYDYTTITNSLSKSLEVMKRNILLEDDMNEIASARSQEVVYGAPIKITNEVASKSIKEWLNLLSITPIDIHLVCDSKRLKPVYVPYFYFIADAMTYYQAYTNPPVQKVEGEHRQTYSNILLCARDPIDSAKIESFREDFKVSLAKIPMETIESEYSVESPGDWLHIWKEYLQNVIHPAEEKNCCKLASNHDGVNEFSCNVTFSNIKYKLLYFPIYESYFTFNGDRHFIAVNGITGKVTGLKPGLLNVNN